MPIEEKISEYFTNKKEIAAVYVFGSFALGKQRNMSDVDIGILFDEGSIENSGKKKIEYMLDLARILRKDIHLTILNDASEELLRQIFRKGKCILVNNQKKLSAYKMIKFAKIADFGFYRSQMQAGFERKIMET